MTRQNAINKVKELVKKFNLHPTEFMEIKSIKDRNPFVYNCSNIRKEHDYIKVGYDLFVCKHCGKELGE